MSNVNVRYLAYLNHILRIAIQRARVILGNISREDRTCEEAGCHRCNEQIACGSVSVDKSSYVCSMSGTIHARTVIGLRGSLALGVGLNT